MPSVSVTIHPCRNKVWDLQKKSDSLIQSSGQTPMVLGPDESLPGMDQTQTLLDLFVGQGMALLCQGPGDKKWGHKNSRFFLIAGKHWRNSTPLPVFSAFKALVELLEVEPLLERWIKLHSNQWVCSSGVIHLHLRDRMQTLQDKKQPHVKKDGPTCIMWIQKLRKPECWIAWTTAKKDINNKTVRKLGDAESLL